MGKPVLAPSGVIRRSPASASRRPPWRWTTRMPVSSPLRPRRNPLGAAPSGMAPPPAG